MRSEDPKKGSGGSGKSSSATPEAGSQLARATEGSLVFLDTGATANLAGLRMLVDRNSLLGNLGVPRVETSPDQATLKLGAPVWATCVMLRIPQ